jgi:hypothetical protein
MAMSAAASVEGRMKMCSSASSRLERVTRGSTQIIRTPRFLAHLRYCSVPVPKVPSAGLQPHMTMRREFA